MESREGPAPRSPEIGDWLESRVGPALYLKPGVEGAGSGSREGARVGVERDGPARWWDRAPPSPGIFAGAWILRCKLGKGSAVETAET